VLANQRRAGAHTELGCCRVNGRLIADATRLRKHAASSGPGSSQGGKETEIEGRAAAIRAALGEIA
jgi:hypothetical protein